MPQQELLRRVVEALEALRIEYMVTGSIASSMQGEPRSTHDIDLVVAISSAAARRLAKAFPAPDYYLDEATAVEAIGSEGMFNLLDVKGGEKVDFWVLTDDPFDQSRFSRRRVEQVAGLRLSVSRPEDTILMKLRWSEMSGGSEKQFTDALRIYEVQLGQLDTDYLELWASRLNVEALWIRLKNQAKPV